RAPALDHLAVGVDGHGLELALPREELLAHVAGNGPAGAALDQAQEVAGRHARAHAAVHAFLREEVGAHGSAALALAEGVELAAEVGRAPVHEGHDLEAGL